MDRSLCRSTLRLLIYALFLTVAFGCTYHQNPGLLLNGYQTSDPGLLVLSNRTVDTDTGFGGAAGIGFIQFHNPIDIMQADSLNYWIRVCDHGILHLADTKGNLQLCIKQASVNGIGAANPQPIIIADSINQASTGINFTAEFYHILRTEQVGSDSSLTGPSSCDIEIIEGLINDCEEEHRFNQSVQEFAVVTWNTPDTSMYSRKTEYVYQVVVAVTTENRTYVMFLFNDTQTIMSGNGVAKGIIHAANAGLTGSEKRISQICNAVTDTDLHKKSNCRCAQKGHFIFETTETTPEIHGFCGTEAGKQTCATEPAVDSGTNVNRNCRTPITPQINCDGSAYCTSGTSDQLIILFKNYNADRVSFVNYTQFTQNDGSTGYEAPYGDNVHVIDDGAGMCTFTVVPSNGTFRNVTLTVPSSSNCFEVDSSTNTINYVLLFWNSVDGVKVTTLNTRFLAGSCDLDDLPSLSNISLKAGDIAKTTPFPGIRTQLVLLFYDRKSQNSAQPFFFLTKSIQLGRMIFPQVCFTPKTPFIADVTAYGVYVFSCQLSNNPDFIHNGGNVTINVIQADGCLSSSPGSEQSGRFVDHFKRDAKTLDAVPFCVLSGGFRAFKWGTDTASTFIYMRCKTNVCFNTQLYLKSKCKDSCANTIIDVDVNDADDAGRRKRQFNDVNGQVVTGVIEVIDPDQTDQDKMIVDKYHCVDPSMAKGVIGGLVALLIISTVLTIVLFFVLKSTRPA